MSELVEKLRLLGRETVDGRDSITWQAADRITRLEADRAAAIEHLEALSAAAYDYAGNYLLDDRTDPNLPRAFPNLHARIVALFDAIEAANDTLGRIQGGSDGE